MPSHSLVWGSVSPGQGWTPTAHARPFCWPVSPAPLGSWLPPGQQECLILETAGYERGLCLLASLNTSVRCAVEEAKPESVVSSAQQRAWRGVRAQSTASLVTSSGSVSPVSMILALTMELALRRFRDEGRRDRPEVPRLRNAVPKALTALLLCTSSHHSPGTGTLSSLRNGK